MSPEGDEWFDRLQQHAARCRDEDPIPARETLSEAVEFQCRIIGGHMIQWLHEWGPRLLMERKAHNADKAVEDEPFVLFLTDTPGLVAAREILDDGDDSPIAYMRAGEFEAFSAVHPDEQLRWHITVESGFHELTDEAERALALRKHALQPGEVFWIHHAVSTLRPQFARGGGHLWVWDGKEAQMVEDGFSAGAPAS